MSTYWGGTSDAELIAAIEQARSDVREHKAFMARQAWRRLREQLGDEEEAIADHFAAIEAIADAALNGAGYFKHKRGEYRRRSDMSLRKTKLVPDETLDALNAGMRGDKAALAKVEAELRRLDRAGDDVGLEALAFFCGGDISHHSTGALIDSFLRRKRFAPAKEDGVKVDPEEPEAGSPVDLVAKAMRLHADTLRRRLAGADPTPLEALLADRAVYCWMDAHRRDQYMTDNEAGMQFKEAEYRSKQADRAHRRFLMACKTLATVRRLIGPGVVLNVHTNVNVEAPAQPEPEPFDLLKGRSLAAH